jgi:P-type Ca2+ transporter type 2C
VSSATLDTLPPVTVTSGLEPLEAALRLAEHGPNELPPPVRPRLAARVVGQLTEPLTLLLLGAAVVSGLALSEPLDAVAILAIVVLNVVIALVEEGRAGAALDALRRLESPQARVRRGGQVVVVPAREVVPGDVVLVAAGDRVPADVVLHQAERLEVDEAILTGESLPVRKHPQRAGEEEGDGETCLLSGTLVTAGTGEGVATATGAGTALGRIAAHVQVPQPPTPLQRELAGATAWLGTAAMLVAVVVFGLVLAVTEGAHRFGRCLL